MRLAAERRGQREETNKLYWRVEHGNFDEAANYMLYFNMNLEQFMDTEAEYYYYCYCYQSCTVLLCKRKGVQKGRKKYTNMRTFRNVIQSSVVKINKKPIIPQ